MREDTRTAWNSHSIDPGTALPRVAEQLGSLSPIFVVRGVNHRTSPGVNPTISLLFCSAKPGAHATAATIATTAAAAERNRFISLSRPKLFWFAAGLLAQFVLLRLQPSETLLANTLCRSNKTNAVPCSSMIVAFSSITYPV